LRLLISKAEFEAIKQGGEGGLRNRLQLPDQASSFPPTIISSIKKWLTERRKILNSNERFFNFSIAVLDLSIYAASSFGRRYQNKKCAFICGDSAAGVPFFRALNNGLLCATKLAQEIVSELQSGGAHEAVFPNQAAIAEKRASSLPAEDSGFLGKMFSSMGASTGVSKNLAVISARGATEMVQDMVRDTPDPVLRYQQFVTRLVKKEFNLATAKRDALSIVRLSNQFRTSVSGSMSSWAGKGTEEEEDDETVFERD
jgi:hypothetical protein